MTRHFNPFKDKKTRKLLEDFFEVFPSAWFVEIREVEPERWEKLFPPARKGRAEPERAGGGIGLSENYELFGTDWKKRGGGT